ncbi:hypothetical protein LNP24_20920 [Klebsiella pneumoniae subsp. pneumoniae]|nr:hypothetical protein [Klebsiella pneumoniae subsp. pneumoniae]
MTGWRVTRAGAVPGAPRRPDAGDRHQRAAGERGRDYRLYRPVRAAAGENAWRPSAAAARLLLAALIGALLLWLSDQVILWLEPGMAGSLHRLGHRPDWRAAAAVVAAAVAQHQRPGDERRR